MNKRTLFTALACAVALTLTCRAAGDTYLVVDLSAGNVPSPVYPVSYTHEPPAGGWTNVHKTSSLVFRRVGRGSFLMGTPPAEMGVGGEPLPQQTVALSNDYYLGLFEVTEDQYRRLTTSPSGSLKAQFFSSGLNDGAGAFLTQLNMGAGGLTFSLPTEAQWEYACRAGATNAYSFGSDPAGLAAVAVYGAGAVQPVATKAPNAWGFYDLHGNADEAAVEHGGSRSMQRGGLYSSVAAACRSDFRIANDDAGGFRVCLTVPTVYYTVAVTNGAGGGSYTNGHVVTLAADPPAALKRFNRWTGDTLTVADVFAPTTTLTVAGAAVAVTATYSDAPYTLTVHGGTGDGDYAAGAEVPIAADAPGAGLMFDFWRIDLGPVGLGAGFAARSASTTVTMPAAHVILTAVYTNVPTYTLTVAGGTGGGSYTNGQTVAISAPPPGAHHTFLWTGAAVADPASPATTLVMPAADTTVTATYPPRLYALTVAGGTGGGSYTNGQAVTVVATNRPTVWHTFDAWAGDLAGVADVSAVTTTVTVAGATALTATYRPLPAVRGTYLVVDLMASTTNAAVTYVDEPPVGGWTASHKTDKLVLKRVPAGTFAMGAAPGESTRVDETRHAVTLTRDFYLGLYEVTQAQWARLTSAYPSAYTGADAPRHPVERVSYSMIRGASWGAKWPSSAVVDSGSFIDYLRTKTGDARFDLPTEAQWEYACRAGTTGAYAGTLADLGVYGAISDGKTWEVGSKAPNGWGFYDMHGNVSELCLDWYTVDLGSAAQVNPPGPASSPLLRRVMRGGGYLSVADACRSAARGNLLSTNAYVSAGLRVARAAAPLYALTVSGGTVNTGGLYEAGTKVGVSAARQGLAQVFASWTVVPAGAALGAGFDPLKADTALTMPSHAVTLTATYAQDPGYTILTVAGGTGGGGYTNGTVAVIAADGPPEWQVFDVWTGDTAGVADVSAATTTVTLAGGTVSLAATYRPVDDLPADVFRLARRAGAETNAWYVRAGTERALTAPEFSGERLFGWWRVEPADSALGVGFDASAASTGLVMPTNAVTLTAVYVVNPGSSTGFLEVALSDADGAPLPDAQWSPDGGANWYPAGRCPLKPASYTVSFRGPTVNWVAPDSVRVALKAGATAAVTGRFRWVGAVADGGAAQAGVGVAFAAVADVGVRPAAFKATGVPPGLKLNGKNGVLAGVPTKVGTYVVGVTAKGADGSVASGTFAVTVLPLAERAQGTYSGCVGTDLAGADRTVSGLFTLTVGPTGKLSAKVTAQAAAYSFTGASWDVVRQDGAYAVTVRTAKGEALLQLALNPADGVVSGVVSGGVFGDGGAEVAGFRNPYLNPADTDYAAAVQALAGLKGYYTVALPALACRSEGLAQNVQGGFGYLTLTVGDKGAVALSGRLAEGTSFSASATFVPDDVGGVLPLFVPLYGKRGVLAGLLALRAGVVGPASNRVELCDGVPLAWVYPGKSAVEREDRFEVDAGAFGAYYGTLVSVREQYEGARLAADRQAWVVPLAFLPTGAAYLAAGAENPARATLKVAPKTGLFSGSFLAGGMTVSYAGVLTYEGDEAVGCGAYVLPQAVPPYKVRPSFGVLIE